MGGVNAICGYFFEFKRKIAKYFTRHYIKGNGVLPDAKFFEASINVFAIHGVIYAMNRRIFQRDGVSCTHYSSIPTFHHSNCERSELRAPRKSQVKFSTFFKATLHWSDLSRFFENFIN